MYRAVKLVLFGNEASWNGLPAFESAYTALSEKIVQLVNAGNTQRVETVGVAKRKQEVRLKMTKAVVKLAKILRAYALDNDLTQLGEQLKLTKTSFERGSQVKASQLVAFVIEAATEHVSNLEDYGYLPEHLSEAEALYAEFQELRSIPRQAVISRKQMTRAIEKVVKELDSLLKNKLDALMLVYEDEQERFYNNYRDARIIVDYVGSKSSGMKNAGSEGSGKNPISLWVVTRSV